MNHVLVLVASAPIPAGQETTKPLDHQRSTIVNEENTEIPGNNIRLAP